MEVSRRKQIQTVFTTHSDYALQPLPTEAIWACMGARLEQGKLSVETLRALSGRVDKRLAVFVEDDFAKAWLEAVLREQLGVRMEEVGLYGVYGDGNAVRTHLSHTTNPAVNFRSLCFLDGDSEQHEDAGKGVYRLPGGAPESTVFDVIAAGLEKNVALLTVACQLSASNQDKVLEAVRQVSHTNRDPHLLYSQVGIKRSEERRVGKECRL